MHCRWTPENKAKLNPYAYMPFGMGPRNCLAMRFGLEEVKLILCKLIKEFHFFPVEETPVNIWLAFIYARFWTILFWKQEKLVPPPGLFSSDPVESLVGISSRTWKWDDEYMKKQSNMPNSKYTVAPKQIRILLSNFYLWIPNQLQHQNRVIAMY